MKISPKTSWIIFIGLLVLIVSQLVVLYLLGGIPGLAPFGSVVKPPASSDTFQQFTPGLYFVAADEKSFIVNGVLEKVYKNSLGNTVADISMNPSDPRATVTFLLAGTQSFAQAVALTRQNSTIVSPSSKNMKTTVLRGDAIVPGLNAYRSGTVRITVATDFPQLPSNVKQQASAAYTAFMKNGFACNTRLLAYLETPSRRVNCQPYSLHVNVYVERL